MIRTRDEIILALATSLSDVEDIPFLEGEEFELIYDPEKKQPISRREKLQDPYTERGLIPGKYEGTEWPWKDPMPGSPQWEAKYHTKEYLRGVNKPYRGFSRDPQYDEITKTTMDRLVAIEPEKYFEWDLGMRQELKPWLVTAAKNLIDKDPYIALIKGIFKYAEIANLLPKLWKDIVNLEFNRSINTKSGEMFPGILLNRMRQLTGVIAKINPAFYRDEIVESEIGKKFRTDRFDNWAINALRE